MRRANLSGLLPPSDGGRAEKTNRRRTNRRGAALVEAAIVMNIFLLFLFGIMEFGHFVMTRQIIDNAAREGARLASTGTATLSTSDITAAVTTKLVGQGPTNLNIQVFQADPQTGANVGAWTSASLGQPIAIKISGNYKPMLSMAALLPTSIPISTQVIVYSESPN
jgi:Flp pilus assembly protein TadG